MQENFDKFNQLLQDGAIFFDNEKLMKTIKEFSLYFISDNFEFDKHQEIKTNIKNSEVIMINNCNFNNQKEIFCHQNQIH